MTNTAETLDTKAWRTKINKCLNNGGPTIVYQPIYSLEPHCLIGYEALSRFPGDDCPVDWFEAADLLGLDYELEILAAHNALAALKTVPSPIYIAVNFSPATVIHPTFLKQFDDYDLSRVVMELTEHDPVNDYGQLREVLDPIRGFGAIVCTPVGPSSAPRNAEGVKLSVDDLGAGFASMRHVLNLEPDYMKIDVALVRGIDTSVAQRALVSALVTFGNKMNVRVVSEGVETEAEFVTLRALDVFAAQGFLLGRPGPLPSA